jgi:hypothetical protein
MYRSTRITSAVAVVASALALAPAAVAGGVTPDNRAERTGPAGLAVVAVQTPDNRADRTGPAGARATGIDTTGVGLIHASAVNAAVAARAATATTDTGFQWTDAGIGAGAGFAAALGCAGLAGVRGRRRVAA